RQRLLGHHVRNLAKVRHRLASRVPIEKRRPLVGCDGAVSEKPHRHLPELRGLREDVQVTAVENVRGDGNVHRLFRHEFLEGMWLATARTTRRVYLAMDGGIGALSAALSRSAQASDK